MKKRVELSTISMILTCLVLIWVGGLVLWHIEADGYDWRLWGLIVLLVALVALNLFYAPLWISISDGSLNIERSLRIKSIPLDEIADVKLCKPTMGARRICGSGGFAGYWGWFSERDLGRYFAYYGKASDCFLVTLKNGHKYMLGCKDAPEVVEALTALTRR